MLQEGNWIHYLSYLNAQHVSILHWKFEKGKSNFVRSTNDRRTGEKRIHRVLYWSGWTKSVTTRKARCFLVRFRDENSFLIYEENDYSSRSSEKFARVSSGWWNHFDIDCLSNRRLGINKFIFSILTARTKRSRKSPREMSFS